VSGIPFQPIDITSSGTPPLPRSPNNGDPLRSTTAFASRTSSRVRPSTLATTRASQRVITNPFNHHPFNDTTRASHCSVAMSRQVASSRTTRPAAGYLLSLRMRGWCHHPHRHYHVRRAQPRIATIGWVPYGSNRKIGGMRERREGGGQPPTSNGQGDEATPPTSSTIELKRRRQ